MKLFALTITALAGFVVAVKGDTCYCTEEYEPVCASNGQVFSNLCMLRCHNYNNKDNLQVAEFDRCTRLQTLFALSPKYCFITCPHIPLPVCGSNGVTYGSSCALKCLKQMHSDLKNVTIAHHGRCTESA